MSFATVGRFEATAVVTLADFMALPSGISMFQPEFGILALPEIPREQ